MEKLKFSQVKYWALALVLVLSLPYLSIGIAHATCNSTSNCASELQQLKKQQKDAENKKLQSKQDAQNIQGVIGDLVGDISYTQSRISNTEQQVILSNQIIADLTKSIADSDQRLASAYVTLYELSRTGTSQLLFQKNLNDALTQAQYIQSIQVQLQKDLDSLHTSKAEQEQQKSDLEDLKGDLVKERASLSSQKSQQAYLLNVANSNAAYYQGLSADIQKQIADVERRLSILISQQSWGSDILSANSNAWYFSQLDPAYRYVRLGNSPYTIGQYGCLITSIAMVSTFYGRRVTPANMATITSNFNSEGYLIKQPPDPVTFSSMSSSPVNWPTVNAELDSGHPVIVSIYISSVGAINSDGSSHFIVLHGRSNGKYLMHDPLGDGRSYAAKDVRSMKIIRP